MRDGTMSLCAYCHRAITAWNDHPLILEGVPPEPEVNWLHFHRDDTHDADPMRPFFDRTSRTLVCAGCRQPQTWDRGWHCERCDHT